MADFDDKFVGVEGGGVEGRSDANKAPSAHPGVELPGEDRGASQADVMEGVVGGSFPDKAIGHEGGNSDAVDADDVPFTIVGHEPTSGTPVSGVVPFPPASGVYPADSPSDGINWADFGL